MPTPETRAVTLQWSNHAMIGDEQLELWLKRLAGSWALDTTIAVEGTATQTHDFTLPAGGAYQFQVRARRGGTYHDGYGSSDPDSWPAASLLAQTLGLPKPELTSGGWERTSGTVQVLHFSWTNADGDRDVIFQKSSNGGMSWSDVDTIAAGTSDYDYEIQGGEAGGDLDFRVLQEDDESARPNPSDSVTAYCGMEPPTSLSQSGGPPNFYAYTADWLMGHAGAKTRVADHYDGSYVNRTLTAADAVTATVTGLPKNSTHLPNGNVTHDLIVRVRHELTSFAVTDVSAWISAPPENGNDYFIVDLADDETAYAGP